MCCIRCSIPVLHNGGGPANSIPLPIKCLFFLSSRVCCFWTCLRWLGRFGRRRIVLPKIVARTCWSTSWWLCVSIPSQCLILLLNTEAFSISVSTTCPRMFCFAVAWKYCVTFFFSIEIVGSWLISSFLCCVATSTRSYVVSCRTVKRIRRQQYVYHDEVDAASFFTFTALLLILKLQPVESGGHWLWVTWSGMVNSAGTNATTILILIDVKTRVKEKKKEARMPGPSLYCSTSTSLR